MAYTNPNDLDPFDPFTAADYTVFADNDRSFNDGTGFATGVLQKNPYCFRAYASGGTTLTDGSVVTIALAVESYDYNSNFAVNTYTAPLAGVYHFDGAVGMTSSASPVFAQARVYNGATAVIHGMRLPADSVETAWMVSGDVLLAANDTITLRFVQDSGGNETSVTGTETTYLSGHLVHPV